MKLTSTPGILVLAIPLAVGCGGGLREREPVATTTTTAASTSALTVVPNDDPARTDDLYLGTDDRSPCLREIAPTVVFAPGAVGLDVSERMHLDAWAQCVNQPEMRHTTVLVTGGVDAAEDNELFLKRAAWTKDALIARGVERNRILVQGDTRPGRAAKQDVRLEVTHVWTPRALVPRDPIMKPSR